MAATYVSLCIVLSEVLIGTMATYMTLHVCNVQCTDIQQRSRLLRWRLWKPIDVQLTAKQALEFLRQCSVLQGYRTAASALTRAEVTLEDQYLCNAVIRE